MNIQAHIDQKLDNLQWNRRKFQDNMLQELKLSENFMVDNFSTKDCSIRNQGQGH